MRITDWLEKDKVAKKYPIFKGYPVRTKKREEKIEQQYVVPWEMPREEYSKTIH